MHRAEIIESSVDKLNLINELIDQRRYIKVQFFNELHEFHTVSSLIKTLHGRTIELVSGQFVNLDLIVSLNDHVMSDYSHIVDFTCDC